MDEKRQIQVMTITDGESEYKDTGVNWSTTEKGDAGIGDQSDANTLAITDGPPTHTYRVNWSRPALAAITWPPDYSTCTFAIQGTEVLRVGRDGSATVNGAPATDAELGAALRQWCVAMNDTKEG